MKKDAFIESVADAVQLYLDNFDRYQPNAHIRVNPVSLEVMLISGADMLAAIADSDEAVEDSAAADGEMTEQAADYQASQNPDFYPVGDYIEVVSAHEAHPDRVAIARLAEKYLG